MKYKAELIDKWIHFSMLEMYYENKKRWMFIFETIVLLDTTLNALEISKYSDSGYIVWRERIVYNFITMKM